jgi:predicted DNA-binding WGR domain protein
MTTTISICEGMYVDPRAGKDKFFRTFAFGTSWATQYGKNGSRGTFTKIVTLASPQAAQAAADAKFATKVKEGYTPSRAGEITSPFAIDSTNLTALDDFAELLPEGAMGTIVSEPVSVADLGGERVADLTTAVHASLLGLLGAWVATPSDKSPALPMRPMLASVVSAEVIGAAMQDEDWVAQFKYDGDRVVIEVTDGDIRVLNRQGQEKVRNVGRAHLLPFSALNTGRWVFDGEVVGRTLVLYDLAAATDGASTWVNERTPFSIRYTALSAIVEILGIPEVASASADAPVVLAPVASTNTTKDQFLATAVAEQREGIILRHLDGLYEHGRRSTTLVKHKLIKDADVIITSLHGTKSSATLAVHDTNGALVEVGSVSTIGKGEVLVGDVWVVTFLYVTNPEHPHLFQPRLVRKRNDKSAITCTIDQFVDAGTNRKV